MREIGKLKCNLDKIKERMEELQADEQSDDDDSSASLIRKLRDEKYSVEDKVPNSSEAILSKRTRLIQLASLEETIANQATEIDRLTTLNAEIGAKLRNLERSRDSSGPSSADETHASTVPLNDALRDNEALKVTNA